jgi:predicted ATP-dependent endonuclease of OLD family
VKTDNLYGEKIDSLITNNDIDNLNNFLNKKITEAIKEFKENKNIKKYMYLRSFIINLFKNTKKSFNIFEQLFYAKFNLDFPFFKILEENLYSKEKEKFDNYIISLNQLLSNKYLEEENKIRIEIFNNDDEIKSIVLNAEMHYFEISVWSDINNKKINFQSLSSGEQKLLLLFAKLNYVVSKDYIKNKKNYILLLDEPEVYIHPDWQKKLISNFINFIKKHKILKEKNVHLIITSHSPFILSDLPKENVIFLKNGKQVDVDIETFGANIHTLLSHGFFMENGLMGEFAKSEIDKVIELLNSEKNLSKKKLNFCKSIISIIGEPVLKSTLQNMLDEKMYSKETRLDKLRRKQKELEDEIKKEKQKAKPDEED